MSLSQIDNKKNIEHGRICQKFLTNSCDEENETDERKELSKNKERKTILFG